MGWPPRPGDAGRRRRAAGIERFPRLDAIVSDGGPRAREARRTVPRDRWRAVRRRRSRRAVVREPARTGRHRRFERDADLLGPAVARPRGPARTAARRAPPEARLPAP